MQRTLVLDISYQPINTVPFTKALRYIAKGKVDLLEAYDRAIHPDWQMPAVVRLTHWIKPHRHRVRFSRQNVLARDRWRCQYCGERKATAELTFDHVLPRSRGGKTAWENVVIACRACNGRKSNRTPAEAGMRLRTRPVRPRWLPLFNLALQGVSQVPAQWRDYWSVELLP